jgi:hypothetical protein
MSQLPDLARRFHGLEQLLGNHASSFREMESELQRLGVEDRDEPDNSELIHA